MKKLFTTIIAVAILVLFSGFAYADTEVNAGFQYDTILSGGKVLTIDAPSGTTGTVIRLGQKPGEANQSSTSVSSADLIFGPYEQSERFRVICTAGTITIDTAYSDKRPTIVTIVMNLVDYTLSAAEALCDILVVTGSPSGLSIIAPTVDDSGVSRLYTVRNAGGDSGTVTIKATGQTGVDIATGKTAEVYWLTDDYVRKTADASH
jgi:phenylacetate-coenzyme A ligase PaaK-like adenylate-forming protein